MTKEEYNNALCREKHRQIDSDISEIKETLKLMNDKLDERFVRRGEVKLVWLAVMAVAGFFGWKIGG